MSFSKKCEPNGYALWEIKGKKTLISLMSLLRQTGFIVKLSNASLCWFAF